MKPASPKGHDLLHDGRYVLLAVAEDSGGGGGEFLVTDRACPLDDPAEWAAAAGFASYTPEERYVLFELGVERTDATAYDASGEPGRQRWLRGEG
jgi:hypothetical protein